MGIQPPSNFFQQDEISVCHFLCQIYFYHIGITISHVNDDFFLTNQNKFGNQVVGNLIFYQINTSIKDQGQNDTLAGMTAGLLSSSPGEMALNHVFLHI